ncbi:uncharacterized protein V1516DRAFT_673662 [Lipomyces oligophaga]|uniref:uncharacterized protein n=1 Tax=Lipomyces oligophaga TaxID=45792 RepID=UPI0034CEB927
MADSQSKLITILSVYGKKFSELLNDVPPYHENVSAMVSEFRQAVEKAILADIETAAESDLDNMLWMKIHYAVIDSYRKQISKLRPQAKSRPTEARKLEAQFVKFVKSAMHFYSTFIQQCAITYKVVELKPIINRLRVNAKFPRAASSQPVSAKITKLVIQSCHRSLICLGDLSRYREVNTFHNDENSEKLWRPAINFYKLALQLIPSNGFPLNQLAVIASLEGSVLRATYYFFRAISVESPFPTAPANLELAFKKFLKSGTQYPKEEMPLSELIACFLRWHAMLYQTYSGLHKPPEISELELSAPMGQLEILFQEAIKTGKVTTDAVNTIAVINLSALSFSLRRKSFNCFKLLLSLIFKFMSLMWTALEVELKSKRERFGTAEVRENGLSLTSRRLLVGLRIYSTWLRGNISELLAVDELRSEIVSDPFWKVYCSALVELSSIYTSTVVIDSDSLLKEDVELLGFLPCRRGLSSIRQRAEQMTFDEIEESVSKLHPNSEIDLRIADILDDAISTTRVDKVPILYENQSFIFLATQSTSPPHSDVMMNAMVDLLLDEPDPPGPSLTTPYSKANWGSATQYSTFSGLSSISYDNSPSFNLHSTSTTSIFPSSADDEVLEPTTKKIDQRPIGSQKSNATTIDNATGTGKLNPFNFAGSFFQPPQVQRIRAKQAQIKNTDVE